MHTLSKSKNKNITLSSIECCWDYASNRGHQEDPKDCNCTFKSSKHALMQLHDIIAAL